MLIFGGDGMRTFTLDRADQKEKKVEVKTTTGVMKLKSPFVQGYDHCARSFGNYIYAVDGYEQALHVFDQGLQAWEMMRLSDFGVDK